MSVSHARQLEEKGVVVLHGLLSADQLKGMQEAFEARLCRLRWNDFDGFEKTEPYRHMVQDVLTLAQGFVDLALHPDVKRTLHDYIGADCALVEAKGWRSLPTAKDFHGWHGDAWYDQGALPYIPREVKLAIYLTDVRSGAFQYIKGSHGKQAPRVVARHELTAEDRQRSVEVTGAAGTAFLFDTSGIHRQAMPILERRHAVFYNYHDPRVPLLAEDVDYYRYHPLLLNAAFLGGLTEEDQRVLGFGDKTNHVPAFARGPKHEVFQGVMRRAFDAKLRLDGLRHRVAGKVGRLIATTRQKQPPRPVRTRS